MVRSQGLFLRYGATALKCAHGPATRNTSWVCYGALPEAALALWRGCFEMRTRPLTTQHKLGMLCCMLRPRHDTHTHTLTKVPKVSDEPIRRRVPASVCLQPVGSHRQRLEAVNKYVQKTLQVPEDEQWAFDEWDDEKLKEIGRAHV